MGGICADGGMQEPTFSTKHDYGSSGDYFSDDDSDVHSFVSARSRDGPGKSKRTPYPSQVPNLHSYRMSPEGNLVEEKIHPRLTAKASSSNVFEEDSHKTEAILVKTDDDVKNQIKQLMEPYLFQKVQRLVDKTVDELFMKVNSPQVLSQGSRQSLYLSQKADSVRSSEASPHGDKKHNRKDFENIKRDGPKSKAIVVTTPSKLHFHKQLSNDAIDDPKFSDDESVKSLVHIQVLANFDTEPQPTGRRISNLKLDQFCSENLELKSGGISPMSAESLEKFEVHHDNIREISLQNNFESDQKVIVVQKLSSINAGSAKMSSRESTPNASTKLKNDGSGMSNLKV